MELDKVLNLIVPLQSKSIVDRVEWLTIATEIMAELKVEYKGKFTIININLRSKIIEPEFLAKFESYPSNKDRLSPLLKYYTSAEFKSILAADAKGYRQDALDIIIYFNNKIRLLRSASIELGEYINLIKEGMDPEDRKKLGHVKINDLVDLEDRIMSIGREREMEKAGQVNSVDDPIVSQLRNRIELLTEQLNYVNYEGRGRRGRGRGTMRNN